MFHLCFGSGWTPGLGPRPSCHSVNCLSQNLVSILAISDTLTLITKLLFGPVLALSKDARSQILLAARWWSHWFWFWPCSIICRVDSIILREWSRFRYCDCEIANFEDALDVLPIVARAACESLSKSSVTPVLLWLSFKSWVSGVWNR